MEGDETLEAIYLILYTTTQKAEISSSNERQKGNGEKEGEKKYNIER